MMLPWLISEKCLSSILGDKRTVKSRTPVSWDERVREKRWVGWDVLRGAWWAPTGVRGCQRPGDGSHLHWVLGLLLNSRAAESCRGNFGKQEKASGSARCRQGARQALVMCMLLQDVGLWPPQTWQGTRVGTSPFLMLQRSPRKRAVTDFWGHRGCFPGLWWCLACKGGHPTHPSKSHRLAS